MWNVRGASIPLDMPVVMGILNATPDSFSDGGLFGSSQDAIAAGLEMSLDGAKIIDVGGESTRPGSVPVSADEELRRILPIVEGLSAKGLLVSVDTSKPLVAQQAIDAGASIVNDITGLGSAEMRSVCAETGVGVVIMHSKGTPATMQSNPHYEDVVSEVTEFLVNAAQAAIDAGIRRDAIVVDPGIGFGKSFDHNIELLAQLEAIVACGYPVLLGTSRKGFLGKILQSERGETVPNERDGATAGTLALAVAKDVKVLRVHNVALAADVARVVKAIVPLVDGKETNRT